MNKATFQENIDKYLDGLLKGNDLEDFKNALNTNDDLKQDLNIHKQARLLLKRSGRLELTQKLTTLKSEVAEEQLPQKRFGLKSIIILIIFISFLIAGYLIIEKNNRHKSVISKAPIALISKDVNFLPEEGRLGGTTVLKKQLEFYISEQNGYKQGDPIKVFLTEADLLLLQISKNNTKSPYIDKKSDARLLSEEIKKAIKNIVKSNSQLIINDVLYLPEID